MSQQSFFQTLASINTAGTLYNTYTTAKSVLGSSTATAASAGVIKIPSNFFQIETQLEIEFHAGVSWVSGNTMTFQVMLGPTSNIIAFASDAIKVTTTGGTTEPVYGKILLTCRSIGSGTLATLMGGGFITGRPICPPGATPAANYGAGMGISSMKEVVPAVGTGFDSTVDNVLDLYVGMGTSSASNGIQIQQYRVTSTNVAGY
jgi:hypothetical protein